MDQSLSMVQTPAPGGPRSRAIVTSIGVLEAYTTQAGPIGLLRIQRRRRTRLPPCIMPAYGGSTSFNVSAPMLPFLYTALSSCTQPFSLRHLHWAQVTESRRLQTQPHTLTCILPDTLNFLALRRKNSPSLTQSRACLCLPSIISHTIFKGKSHLVK